MTFEERYQFWMNADLPLDVKAELGSIAEDTEELKSRFGSDLQFGTAGMRGIMGMGSNRLNRYTVRRAAQGMAAWLSGTDLPKVAAIGYDSRHNSRLFAEVCAVALAEAGIHTWLYDRLAPTPMEKSFIDSAPNNSTNGYSSTAYPLYYKFHFYILCSILPFLS